jgi:hypothetical protein
MWETFPKSGPTKPSKLSFVGSDGLDSRDAHIIRGVERIPEFPTDECPYALPEGVRLVQYTPKAPPVAVTVCSVVNDVPKFIQRALSELDARLRRPIQIKAGDSVFELLSKLAECGLELHLEWPPNRTSDEITSESTENEPAKPAKVPGRTEPELPGAEIAGEDLPF